MITGILLAALGVFIVFKGVTFKSQGSVSVGPIHGTVQERHMVPALFGWVAIVGGVLLVVAGSRRKR
jgi:ABC-type xylose transport system permease subunit